MNTLFTIILTLGIAEVATAQSDLKGTWMTEEGQIKVEFYQLGDLYHGKIVWLKALDRISESKLVDINNPKKELRNRPLIGLDMLMDLKQDGDTWFGKIYAPKEGRTLNVALYLASRDELIIKASYRGFSETQTWTRVTSSN